MTPDDNRGVHPLESDTPSAPTAPRQSAVYLVRLPRPRVVFVLLALIVGVFLLQLFAPGVERAGYNSHFYIFGRGEFWRLFTAMFLHGGLPHLFFNGFSLYVLGPGIEAWFGWRRFLAVYLLGGLTGSLLSAVLMENSRFAASLGASGALFALIGAELVYLYRNRAALGAFGRYQLRQLGFIALLNLGMGFLPGSNIDNWGHIGGLVGGTVLAWGLCPLLEYRPYPLRPDVMLITGLNFDPRFWQVVLGYGALLAALLAGANAVL